MRAVLLFYLIVMICKIESLNAQSIDSVWARNKLITTFEYFTQQKQIDVEINFSFSGELNELDGLENSPFRMIKNEKASMIISQEVLTIQEKGYQLIVDTFNKILIIGNSYENMKKNTFNQWIDTQGILSFESLNDTVYILLIPNKILNDKVKSITYCISKSQPIIYKISFQYNENPLLKTKEYYMHCHLRNMKIKNIELPFQGINDFIEKKNGVFKPLSIYKDYELIDQLTTN